MLTVDLVPYLDRCLEAIFPSSSLAGIMATATSSLANKTTHKLNIQHIVKPLFPLLPQEARNVQDSTILANELSKGTLLTKNSEDPSVVVTTNPQTETSDTNVKRHSNSSKKPSETSSTLGENNKGKKFD